MPHRSARRAAALSPRWVDALPRTGSHREPRIALSDLIFEAEIARNGGWGIECFPERAGGSGGNGAETSGGTALDAGPLASVPVPGLSGGDAGRAPRAEEALARDAAPRHVFGFPLAPSRAHGARPEEGAETPAGPVPLEEWTPVQELELDDELARGIAIDVAREPLASHSPPCPDSSRNAGLQQVARNIGTQNSVNPYTAHAAPLVSVRFDTGLGFLVLNTFLWVGGCLLTVSGLIWWLS